jgi:deoxyguanosine kinase
LNLLHKIFISLGSNQGERLQNIQKSIDVLYTEIGNILEVSPVYETKSWGFDSENFLNCCISLTTNLSPNKLLIEFKRIEFILGRKKKKSNEYEARLIDIDILFYENKIINEVDLQIPHKSIAERKFVLQPLYDIAPYFVHPVFNKTVSELLLSCGDDGIINLFSKKLTNPFNTHKFSKYKFIAIEGNIGSGKTSLSKMISNDFNFNLMLESFTENTFLPKFYNDQARYAFPLEMSFLADRYAQLSEVKNDYHIKNGFIVADYHITKSLLFSKITLPNDEYILYKKFFEQFYNQLKQPDLYIYLHQSTPSLLKNIKKRGRDYEQNIQPEYLEKINNSYLAFIENNPSLNIKIIDVFGLDFVNNRADYIYVLDKILD